MVDRWSRLGLNNPDEWTYAWGTGIITLSNFSQSPSYKAVHTILEDLKEAVHACRKPSPFTRIVEGLATPNALPPNAHKHAYDADDGPVEENIERLRQVVLKHVPLRKSSKLLTKEAAKEATSSVGGGVGFQVILLLTGLAIMLQLNVTPEEAQQMNLQLANRGSPSPSSMSLQEGGAIVTLPSSLDERRRALLSALKPQGSTGGRLMIGDVQHTAQEASDAAGEQQGKSDEGESYKGVVVGEPHTLSTFEQKMAAALDKRNADRKASAPEASEPKVQNKNIRESRG